MNSWNVKTNRVGSVLDMLASSKQGLPSITITSPEKSGDFYAVTATTVLSDGTETVIFSDAWPAILIEELVGSFLRDQSVRGLRKGKLFD